MEKQNPKPTAHNSKSNQAGFTLIETLTTLMIFSVVAILMGGSFLRSLDAQRRAFNLQQAEENASFVLEAMAKEIRVSQISGPDTNCPNSWATTLNITHPVNGNIVYSISGTDIHRNANGTDSIMNSNTVQFTRLQFCIVGTTIDDQKQPRVTIMATIKSAKTKQQQTVDIQTTVSQRFLSD